MSGNNQPASGPPWSGISADAGSGSTREPMRAMPRGDGSCDYNRKTRQVTALVRHDSLRSRKQGRRSARAISIENDDRQRRVHSPPT